MSVMDDPVAYGVRKGRVSYGQGGAARSRLSIEMFELTHTTCKTTTYLP